MGDRDQDTLIRIAATLETIAGEVAKIALKLGSGESDHQKHLKIAAENLKPSEKKAQAVIIAAHIKVWAKQDGQRVIAAYCEAFKTRYGTNPPIDGKAAGIVRNLLKSLPADRLCLLLQAYLQLDDAWLKTRCHDLVTFSQNLTRISVCLDKGRQGTEKTHWDLVDEKGAPDDQGPLRLPD